MVQEKSKARSMEAVRENNQAENDEGESPWGMQLGLATSWGSRDNLPVTDESFAADAGTAGKADK